MVATNAMSYQTADLDTKFATNFPGYDEHLNRGKTGDIKSQGVSYAQYYRSLTDSNRGTALGTLRNLQASSNELRDDSLTMDMLKLQSRNAVGNKDVIQAANEIALHQTQTLKKLHMSMLNQTNLMTQSLAQQNERQAASNAKTQTWHNSGLTRTKGNEMKITAHWVRRGAYAALSSPAYFLCRAAQSSYFLSPSTSPLTHTPLVLCSSRITGYAPRGAISATTPISAAQSSA